ncbi:MAG: hypothetical protein QOD59_1438, partial [Mycobacterium sp.]|nr:hypothetical protein [Mycobacterium sp.]
MQPDRDRVTADRLDVRLGQLHCPLPGGAFYGKFHETRQGSHPITLGKDAPTDYAGKAPRE